MARPSQPPAGAGASGAHNLQLSGPERLAFAHYFSLADPTNSGIVQGSAAVPFFAKARLAPPVLGQIWSIADSDNNGFLTAPTFSVALRLIGHAQRGETPDESLISRPGVPPVLEGIQLPSFPASTPMSPQRTGSTQTVAVEIKPDDRTRYTRIFATAGPSGGLLDGEKAKEIFVKSKLPFDKLGAIWNLADTKARGALDLTDFIIGMHFIQGSMSGSIASVPATLPPGLYEAAAGLPSSTYPNSPVRAQTTGSSAIPRQLTGQQYPGIPNTTLSPTHTGTRAIPLGGGFGSPGLGSGPLGSQRTGMAGGQAFGAPKSQWAVSAEDKTKADRFFDGLDTENKGVLDGQTVVPFFMQSKLSEQTLANIWDLSDITQTGSLSRDEFAVAMHLINAALTGSDVPQELPANLVPPTLRGQKLPEAVNPQQTDTQKDLFSLMDDDEPTPLPISAVSAFAAPTAGAPLAAGATQAPPSRSAVASPFDDDAFFGGDSQSKSISTINRSAASAASSQLPRDQSAELGNKTLQFNSTERAVAELQSRRTNLESEVAQSASSLAELESRLSTVRLTHETETRLVKDLESRKEKQAAELKTVRDELITNESELSRLKSEKDEIEQQVMHDREEIRSTKKQLGEVQAELSALKAEVEKLKKDARQQRGMVAISKKQLSTAEGEMQKLSTEKDEAIAAPEDFDDGTAIQSGTAERSAPGLQAATVPGGLEAIKSPAGSIKSNNPFDRFKASSPAPPQGNGSVTSPALSPATVIGGGAPAGVATASAAAAVGAMHLSGTSSPQQGESMSRDAQEDPWGASIPSQVPTQPVQPPQTTSYDAFDDAFGDDFAPSASAVAETTNNKNSSAAFDDAFGDFDDPSTTAGTGTTSSVDNIEDVPSRTRDAASASESGSEDDALPISGQDKGKTPVRGIDTEANESLSSGDDDEGPEDFENERRGYRSYSPPSRDPSLGDTEAPGSNIGALGATSLASSTLPHSDATMRAEEKFPELPSEAETESQLADASSAGIGQDLHTSGLNSTPADTLSGLTSNAHLSGADVYGSGFVRSQDTGASDAFVDAPTGDLSAALPSNDAISSHAASTDNSPTAPHQTTDPTRSLAGSATGDTATDFRPESPSSSPKTRRAAPPPPKRSTSGSTTATTATATAAVLSASSLVSNSSTPFDDFEASFADLGPVKETTASRSAGAPGMNSSSHADFDDAFDDDADFDFVPSFGHTGGDATAVSGSNQSGSGLSQHVSAPKPTSNADADAFGGFDDAFGTDSAAAPPPPARGVGAGAAPPINFGVFGSGGTSSSAPYGGRSTTGGNNSNSGGTDSSAFSFEDAFAPATGDAGGAATETTSPFKGNLYAPPPGSPPSDTTSVGTNPPPPPAGVGSGLAIPSVTTGGSSAPTANARHSPALADDAGPVRQLAGMGFPRHKVIAALEKSNYRVNKALERLLAES